jgi:hypothetical protein
MFMIGFTGPPTPHKFWMYHLVTALEFLKMIGSSATVFLQSNSYNGLLLVQCQLGL